MYSAHRKLYTNIDTLMPTDNDASNHATKVESVSTDTKRIQTEDPHIVGTYGTPGWSRPIYIEKGL